MTFEFYVTITGQKSGVITGSVTEKGREGSIGGLAMSHSIDSPRDPQSGLPTGQVTHKPFVFTKALDKSTPQLLDLLVTNENVSKCVFKFWTVQTKAATGVGTEVQNYTVTLTNANIASYNAYTANPDQLNQYDATELEDWALTYQKIDWSWNDGGITTEDDWEARA
jgi:type VI secretion system secreted protein Hcp